MIVKEENDTETRKMTVNLWREVSYIDIYEVSELPSAIKPIVNQTLPYYIAFRPNGSYSVYKGEKDQITQLMRFVYDTMISDKEEVNLLSR